MREFDAVLAAEIAKARSADDLVARVDEMIESHRSQTLLSTTGAAEAVAEIIRRNTGLEQAIRALALAVESLAAKNR